VDRDPSIKCWDRDSQVAGYVFGRNATGEELLCRFDLAFGHLPLAAALPSELAGNFKPARVRSMMSSRSISAGLAMTWKKKRPKTVPVSIESVRLLNWTPCF